MGDVKPKYTNSTSSSRKCTDGSCDTYTIRVMYFPFVHCNWRCINHLSKRYKNSFYSHLHIIKHKSYGYQTYLTKHLAKNVTHRIAHTSSITLYLFLTCSIGYLKRKRNLRLTCSQTDLKNKNNVFQIHNTLMVYIPIKNPTTGNLSQKEVNIQQSKARRCTHNKIPIICVYGKNQSGAIIL